VLTDATLTVDVERLTFGFDALAHHDGQVVFVPYGAPGDRVAAEVVERGSDYVRARPLAVLAAGSDRVLPGCRYFPTCGGCQWQHVRPPAQRAAKATIVAEQLARIGGVRDADVLPPLAAPEDWQYRDRITLIVEGRRAGYHRARTHVLLPIEDCPIAAPVVSAHVPAARAWVKTLRAPLERVTIAAAPGGVALTAIAGARPSPADVAASETFLARHASVRGLVLTGGGERIVVGDPTLRLEPEPGLALEVPADVFTQVNAAANRLLVETVLRFGAFAAGERVLDLYCGAGNLSLPVARRAAVVHGIERSDVAVDAARANAERLGLRDASFTHDRVARALRRATPPVDAVILDPPRAGAADAIDAMAALRPSRILYIACDPATFARDVRTMGTHGYRLGRVQPIDLFPQTYHIETAAELRLT